MRLFCLSQNSYWNSVGGTFNKIDCCLAEGLVKSESNNLLVGYSSLPKNLEVVFIVFLGGAGFLCVTSLVIILELAL